MQTSVRSTGFGQRICYLLTLPDPNRSVGRVICCDGRMLQLHDSGRLFVVDALLGLRYAVIEHLRS